MPPFAIAAIILAAVFGLLALWALGWSIAKGQYRDFASGARSIFDEEEPIGMPTDTFPDTAEHLKE
jgi:cbb3-type cytochrome oxidase maturation protein